MVVFLVALSLSMDAFSLALLYGTLNFSKKDILVISLVVGIFHFIMPALGNYLGINIIKYIPISLELITFLIFTFIGIDMILNTNSESEYEKISSLPQIFLFAVSVSIDSFITGVTINALSSLHVLSFLVFLLVSFSMTYLGFTLGKIINLKVGKTSTIVGGIMLILIGIFQLIG